MNSCSRATSPHCRRLRGVSILDYTQAAREFSQAIRRMGMSSYDDIRQLQQYPSGPDSCILSLYVNIDQSDAANLNRGFITQIENLCRQMADDASTSHRERFNEECKRALAFLNDYSARGKGLVIFSDSQQDFWWQR